jgi:SAM-dependent methyltransferase
MTLLHEAPRAIAPRELLARFAIGDGIELGPGHHPFPLPFPGTRVRYADRWAPEQNRDLFPELGREASFPKPDIILNLDTDRMSPIADMSQDFIVASHILEHMADPLGLLAEIYRTLRPGGVAIIFLPDRRRTFDQRRSPTPLAHLIEDHAQRATTVSDEHLEDFLRNTDTWEPSWDGDSELRRRAYELHRQRSIHVHCWSQDEFIEVLEHSVTRMDMSWELLDASFVEETPDGFEFGYALRRSTVFRGRQVMADRLHATWTALAERAARPATTPQAVGDHEVEQWRVRALNAEGRLARIHAVPGYPVAVKLWRAYLDVRRRLDTLRPSGNGRRPT